MKIHLETERFILREIMPEDENDFFEMDADPEVHLYIENKPVTSIEQIREVISLLQKQYKENGIARWAVIDKKSGEWLGWSGLRYYREPVNQQVNFYDLGYRLKRKHWGKGIATETSRAIIHYGFEHLGIDAMYATTDLENKASKHVLDKCGFRHVEIYEEEGKPIDWFRLTKEEWLALQEQK